MQSAAKRAVAQIMERLITLVAAPLGWRPTGPGAGDNTPQRILVVRCDHIGDAAMATPALRMLRDAFPQATITLLAGPWAADAFAGSPLVDDVIIYAAPWWCAARGQPRRAQLAAWRQLPATIRTLRQRRFDLGIDLRGDLRQIVFFLAMPRVSRRVSSDRTGGTTLLSAWWAHDATLHEVSKSCAIAAVAVGGKWGGTQGSRVRLHGTSPLELAGTTLPATLATEIAQASGPAGYVTIALRGNAMNKSWPVSTAAALVEQAWQQLGIGAVFVGGPADIATGNQLRAMTRGTVLNAAGRCSLQETITICAGAAAAIAVDSGPMHLAAAAGVPVVALFGPTDPTLYAPWARVQSVAGPMAPCGCSGQHCARVTDSQYSPCMAAITVEHVMRSLVEVMQTTPLASATPSPS